MFAMPLTSFAPSFPRLLPPHSPLPKLHETFAIHYANASFLPLFWGTSFLPPNLSTFLKPYASVSQSDHEISENHVSELLEDHELLSRVAAAKDACEALQIIAANSTRDGGLVCITDCCSILSAALNQNNVELALSVFFAMRSSFDQGNSSLLL